MLSDLIERMPTVDVLAEELRALPQPASAALYVNPTPGGGVSDWAVLTKWKPGAAKDAGMIEIAPEVPAGTSHRHRARIMLIDVHLRLLEDAR